MRTFRYERPADAPAAVAAVAADPEARFLAGGTNLVDLMKLGVEGPGLLVDITRLPLGRIEWDNGALHVGAGVRNSDLAADLEVRRTFPVLADALLKGASGQLRNMATVGGNLLQRTRCPYFQDVTKPCNKRHPGSGCPARTGEHRNLAVLGTSDACIATHPSDMAVALTALEATVQLEEPAGPRTIPLGDLYRLPGDEPHLATTLARGSLITAIDVAPLSYGHRSAYRKVRDRASYAFAVASVAAAVDVEDGVVTDVRLAFGAAAPLPWRARLAEAALRGRPATVAAFREAADAELEHARPLRDNAFKVPLLRSIMVRTLADLVARPA